MDFEDVGGKAGEVVEVASAKLGCVIRVRRLSAGEILSLSKAENPSVAMAAAALVRRDGSAVYADAAAAMAESWPKIAAALEAVHEVNGIDVEGAGKN